MSKHPLDPTEQCVAGLLRKARYSALPEPTVPLHHATHRGVHTSPNTQVSGRLMSVLLMGDSELNATKGYLCIDGKTATLMDFQDSRNSARLRALAAACGHDVELLHVRRSSDSSRSRGFNLASEATYTTTSQLAVLAQEVGCGTGPAWGRMRLWRLGAHQVFVSLHIAHS